MSLANAKKSLLIRLIDNLPVGVYEKEYFIDVVDNAIPKLLETGQNYRNRREIRDIDDNKLWWAFCDQQANWRGGLIIGVELYRKSPNIIDAFQKVYRGLKIFEEDEFGDLLGADDE